jgi:hypothetical protein
MHVFVVERQAKEIQSGVGFVGGFQPRQSVGQTALQVGAGLRRVGQGQLPAHVVGHATGVVQRLGIHTPRRLACGTARNIRVGGQPQGAVRVAGNPPVGKPADMAQLPQRRIQLGADRHDQRRPQGADCRIEQSQCAGTGGHQRLGQRPPPQAA